jgi:hypothetical protein
LFANLTVTGSQPVGLVIFFQVPSFPLCLPAMQGAKKWLKAMFLSRQS